MIEVKRPELLDDVLDVVTMLHPSKGSLKLSMDDVSEATLTLEDKAEVLPMHSWVKIYNQFGFVGIFRRTSRGQTVTTDNGYTLKHGIDILQDWVWNEETTFEGTKAQFITAILSKQRLTMWTLGTCADTSTVKKDINYDNLLDLLLETVEEGGDYYLSYDQTEWPWRVNVVAKPSAVASEFRLERNIEKCRINDNDSELCTRLYLNVNAMQDDEDLEDDTGIAVKQNASVVRVYNNTVAQAVFGIIEKTADIDIDGDLPDSASDPCPEADAYADDFLERRASVKLQIEIDGQVLKGYTGSDWDESKIGTKVRVALPEYDAYIEERCVTVTYPELYAAPDRVTVSLANALPTYTKSLKATAAAVTKLRSAARGSARQAESFEQHFQITDETGNVLRQAGLKLDSDGLLVYADDNVNMVGSRFNVQADKIGMVVGTYDDGRNYIKAGEIALSINDTTGESTALINASHVNISATTTAHLLSGSIVYDSDGNLVLKESSGGGVLVEHNDSGTTATFGIWDRGTLTGGVMVDQINGQTGTKLTLHADVIDIDGIVDELTSFDVVTGTLKTNNTFEADGEATFHDGADFDGSDVSGITNLTADYITCDSMDINGYDNILVDAEVDTTTNELTITRADGTTVTFSKAANPLTGSWNGTSGVFTATESASNTISTTLYQGTAAWSGTTVTIPVTAMIEGDSTVYTTGKSLTATYTPPSITGAWASGVFTATQENSITTTLYSGTPSWNGNDVTIPINAMISGDSTVYSTGKSVTATYDLSGADIANWVGQTRYTGSGHTITSALTLTPWCDNQQGTSVTITPGASVTNVSTSTSDPSSSVATVTISSSTKGIEFKVNGINRAFKVSHV